MNISRNFGHTTLTVPSPVGNVEIVIMRGGLPRGDSGILIHCDVKRGKKTFRVISNTIPCESWQIIPGQYGAFKMSGAGSEYEELPELDMVGIWDHMVEV